MNGPQIADRYCSIAAFKSGKSLISHVKKFPQVREEIGICIEIGEGKRSQRATSKRSAS